MRTAAAEADVAMRAESGAISLAPRPRPAPTAVAGGDSHGLLLGLFLILLASFVMLTALSRREEDRTRAVLASLHTAFAARAPGLPAPPRDFGSEPTVPGAELVRLDHLLAASLPLAAAAPERIDDRLVLRLRMDALFAPGSATPRRSGRVLLGRVADILGTPPAGLGVEAVVTVGTADLTAATARLAAERAGALARTLAGLGAPAPRFAVGVGEAHPEEVVIALAVRPAPVSESGGGTGR